MNNEIDYRNNRGKRKGLRLFFLCLALLTIGIVGAIGYLPSKTAIPGPPLSGSPTGGQSSTVGVIPTLQTPSSTAYPQVQAASLNYNFGISFGDTLPWLSSQELNKRLDDLVSLKIGWIRFDIAWNEVQPNDAGSFNWTSLDRVVAAANARHIKLLPDIAYAPAWARTSTCLQSDKCAPADAASFAAFAQAAVTRYAPQGISAWEIWNEPNVKGFWEPAPDAAAYTALLKAAYAAIKNQDPSATVITAGLAPTLASATSIPPLNFLQGIYEHGGGKYFDAVGFHPYTFPLLSTDAQLRNAWFEMGSTTPSLRSIMAMNGDAGKQIWMTEYGAPTDGPGVLATSNSDKGNPDHVTEALQAQIISSAIASVRTLPWAGPLFFYTYKDLAASTSTTENFFGIIRYDGTPKPAYSTLKTLL